MCLVGLPMTFLWSSVRQELKWCFNLPTAANAAISLIPIMQKPDESLYIHVLIYSRLDYVVMDNTIHENKKPKRVYHFVASINNNPTIVYKITKQMLDAPIRLQEEFTKALILEAGLQLAEGVHLGKPQVMQVSKDATKQCNTEGTDCRAPQVHVKDNWERSNACWKCGG